MKCTRSLGCILATLLSATLVLAGCGDDGENGQATGPALPRLEALHATRGTHPGIFDTQGRQVLLRGVNLNSLGDYFQGNPSLPPVRPLDATDFPRMASYGFNVVRLILSWSALEPQPGRISTDYLGRVHAAVAAAKAAGIYTVLDMHQDAWGKYIASPPGVSCPVGREAAIGWDGAPEWATITGGASTCHAVGVRELAPAVAAAFDNFYNDREGIQTSLVNVWAAVAREFAREPAVAGYDLLNEPHFGYSLVGVLPLLAAYSGRAIEAIRAAEREAGGPGHIAFFEPEILWPTVDGAFAADFSSDENIVFAPHNYGESLNTIPIEDGFARAVADAAKYQTTFWVGEYGWFSDPPANKPLLERYAREEDRLLVGGTWWQWKQACGDPHSIGHTGGEPPDLLIHFGYTRCPGDVDLGAVPEWAVLLSRPYPRAAPGRLLAMLSDGDAGSLRLSGTGSGELDLWVPRRGSGLPAVSGLGLGTPRTIGVDGGYRVLVPVSGDYQILIDQS